MEATRSIVHCALHNLFYNRGLRQRLAAGMSDDSLLFFTYLVDPTNTFVMVSVQGSDIKFPKLKGSPLFQAPDVNDWFTNKFDCLTGSAYDLVFLYSSLNLESRFFQGDNPLRRTVLFECVGPLDPVTGYPVHPASSEYQWMEIEEVDEINRKTPLGQEPGLYTCSELIARSWFQEK